MALMLTRKAMFVKRGEHGANRVHLCAPRLMGLVISAFVVAMSDIALNADAFATTESLISSRLAMRPALPLPPSATFSEDADPVASVAALNALVPRSKITPLIQSKSNLWGSFQVAWHLALFSIAAFLPHPLHSMISMAFVSAFFFNGLHETVHRTAFRSRLANDAWSQIFGFLTLRPARHYFYYHWQHHKYTGNRELDSELQPGSFLDLPVETPLGYLAYISGVPFWMDAISSMVKHAFGSCPENYLPTNKARRQVKLEARIYLMLYASIFAAAWVNPSFGSALLRFWIIPALLGQPFLRFYLLGEHRGRIESPLIYENTRTIQTNWLYRKLTWSMPYHIEHHAWPLVPFHKLHNAHKLLIEAGGKGLFDQGEVDADLSGRDGYLAFNWKYLKRLFHR